MSFGFYITPCYEYFFMTHVSYDCYESVKSLKVCRLLLGCVMELKNNNKLLVVITY